MKSDLTTENDSPEGAKPSPVRFSLVVSTIGRGQELAKLLDSLLAQTRNDFEVIVVDQSGQKVLEELIRQYAPNMNLIHVRSEKRGASRGRNLGWSYANGEFINFPDDDCWWPSDMLDQAVRLFESRPDLDAFTTNVKTLSRCDSQGGPIDRSNVFLRCPEPALFARRERLGNLRYDEIMGVGSGTPWGSDEGPDLMLRMLERGLTIEYFPELCIYHPPLGNLSPKQLVNRTRSYSRGRGYFLKKHGYSKLHLAKTLLRTSLGVVLAFLTFRWNLAQSRAAAIRGTIAGYRAAGDPPPQVVETPLSQSKEPSRPLQRSE